MNAQRFLLTTAIPSPAIELLNQAGQVIIPSQPPTHEELSALVSSGDFDVIITQLRDNISAELLQNSQIKGVANYAVGFNNIDVIAATQQGIGVANTPGVLTNATADITMSLILGTGRRVIEADRFIREGHFKGWEPDLLLGNDVSGAVLGLAGFGRIARAVAKRALAFDMQVIFAPRPPHHREVSAAELGEFHGLVTQVKWEELVESSDFLSLHVPLTNDTHHLVDAQILKRMKNSSILINTARGPVVDEQALVQALTTGEIAAAGLDVFENEPELTPGLADLDNTMLLPHIGSATVPVRAEMSRLTALNAIAMASNQKPPHAVNPEIYDS
ncbi:2-hydroxyacid dehydrogenase [Corynebacterium glutamicum]|uniref:2-hydroxyacid dehydrogenase n=1 Tax=Corynebacterium glutamicum TaxID=1718 RepID=UPI000744C70A|nr:D-glycerate dehydrogenase [Corynebacterium glutamicum]AMA00926.1 D-glycerate dehydrogenase [Corynebacterium glutamicum]